jgi:2'-5' RNA ligase
MGSCNGEGDLINSFALVSYLPEPLAGFLDRLRNELVDACSAKAHVTALPPRPLLASLETSWSEIHEKLQDVQPFRVDLGEIEIFAVTQVVYLSVNTGHAELKRLHQRLNTGNLVFEEPFVYHPHITLAQDLEGDQVAAAAELAARRWREFPHSRSFLLDRLTLVQNTLTNCWTDLRSVRLSSSVTIPS